MIRALSLRLHLSPAALFLDFTFLFTNPKNKELYSSHQT